jgi:DNA-directed RNA polymerase subunit K/omega
MEENDIDILSGTVGGRFNLVVLYSKRLRDLQRGLPPLVEGVDALTHKEIVVEEIKQKKVWLVHGEEAEALRLERTKEAVKLQPLPKPGTEPPKPPAPPVK